MQYPIDPDKPMTRGWRKAPLTEADVRRIVREELERARQCDVTVLRAQQAKDDAERAAREAVLAYRDYDLSDGHV